MPIWIYIQGEGVSYTVSKRVIGQPKSTLGTICLKAFLFPNLSIIFNKCERFFNLLVTNGCFNKQKVQILDCRLRRAENKIRMNGMIVTCKILSPESKNLTLPSWNHLHQWSQHYWINVIIVSITAIRAILWMYNSILLSRHIFFPRDSWTSQQLFTLLLSAFLFFRGLNETR